jgi:hypothetical protein
MPPTSAPNSLIHFLELIIPAIVGTGVGAGLAFYGVSRTNSHNARENAANQEHQLQVEVAKAKIAAEYRSRDNRWEFRRTIYVALVTSISDVTLVLSQMLNMIATNPSDSAVTPDIQKQIDEYADTLSTAFTTFGRNASLAPLATASGVNSSIMSQATQLLELAAQPKTVKTIETLFASFSALQVALQVNGSKELWGESEPKSETAES